MLVSTKHQYESVIENNTFLSENLLEFRMQAPYRKVVFIELLLFSHQVVSNSLWPLFTLCAVLQASLSFTISWSLLRFMSMSKWCYLTILSPHRPLLLLASIFPSIRVFPNKLALPNRQPKYWSFSFSISPSSEYSGLISFRIYWIVKAEGFMTTGRKADFSYQTKSLVSWAGRTWACQEDRVFWLPQAGKGTFLLMSSDTHQASLEQHSWILGKGFH